MDKRIPIPLELIDIVISECHLDIPTLRSSSLVCRSWSPLAQSHLFSHVRIKPEGLCTFPGGLYSVDEFSYHVEYQGVPSANFSHCGKLATFAALLKSTPHVGPFVRELHVGAYQDEVWPRHSSDIREIVNILLPKLFCLTIKFHKLQSWEELPFTAISKSSKLTYLEISHILFPSVSSFLDFLGVFPALKVLILGGDVCIENAAPVSQVHVVQSKPQLRALTVHTTPSSYCTILDCLLSPSSPINVTTIRSLSLFCRLRDKNTSNSSVTQSTTQLLTHISSPLEHLRLPITLTDPLSKLISVSQLRSLYVCSQAGVPKCLDWLIQTLSQPYSLALTSLSIDVLHTTLFCDDRFEATTKLWTDLAAVLDSSGVNVTSITVRIKGVSRFARMGAQAQDVMKILNGHGRGLETEVYYYRGDAVYCGKPFTEENSWSDVKFQGHT
ncbi:uncharacterized protein BT62DRAFT_928633 [Guyanagaster necrorhizus]|uniref:F-box domain-containing protein n=1 Tax=Guyanagaster necrorhizus TaxID=856835 RepID=A0A9P7W002_9AGAR|nr:uncharacterized protein BT62DRAFT_928633 [Guyanagaster necrorhizus MCA 3950]KAG7449875.1 hypothetical protein BT62DRAFT_928633 [Guyanagaster necrorhizus MCA 3950]